MHAEAISHASSSSALKYLPFRWPPLPPPLPSSAVVTTLGYRGRRPPPPLKPFFPWRTPPFPIYQPKLKCQRERRAEERGRGEAVYAFSPFRSGVICQTRGSEEDTPPPTFIDGGNMGNGWSSGKKAIFPSPERRRSDCAQIFYCPDIFSLFPVRSRVGQMYPGNDCSCIGTNFSIYVARTLHALYVRTAAAGTELI